MKLPQYSRAREGDMDVTMTPMIDVVFLLLIFFVWTASFRIVEQILPSQLSSQMGDESVDIVDPLPEQDFDKVVIRIIGAGDAVSWTINDTPINSADELSTHLQRIVQISDTAPVVLHPDQDVQIGNVIGVYDLAKLAGFEKISFAVNPTSS